jgi:cellulose 1,4-beta-cellobiosidase
MLTSIPNFLGAVDSNPFSNSAGYYVQPSFQAQVQSSIPSCQGVTECKNLMAMKNISTGFWVDKKAKIAGADGLEGALAAAAQVSPPQLFVAVIYNLPNRDCDAFNSIGEICCYTNADGTCDRAKDGDCDVGLKDYFTNFADPIAALFKQYEGKLPIAAVIEPDSLPNLATNLGNPNCANMGTSSAYNNGIPYVIKAINAQAPSVTMYIDAAHGGWLGWEDNAQAYATLVQSLAVDHLVRGFATNVANYQPLGTPCPAEAFDEKMHVWCADKGKGSSCCIDPCAWWSSGRAATTSTTTFKRSRKR